MKDNDLDTKDPGPINPFQALIAKLTGKEINRPRLKPPVNVWRSSRREAIEAMVRQRAEAAGTARGGYASLREKIAREMFSKLDEQEQKRWKEQAQNEHNEALKMWKKEMADPSSTSPEDRQRCIMRLAGFMQPILDSVCEATGWKASFIAGGPEPSDGGRLNVLSIHSGSTTGDAPMNFGRAERVRFKKFILPIYGSFLQKCYSPEECHRRVLNKKDGFMSLEGMIIDDSDSVTLDSVDMSSSNVPLWTSQETSQGADEQAADERPDGQSQPEPPLRQPSLPPSPSPLRTPARSPAHSTSPPWSPPASEAVTTPSISAGSPPPSPSGADSEAVAAPIRSAVSPAVPPVAPSDAHVPSLGGPASPSGAAAAAPTGSAGSPVVPPPTQSPRGADVTSLGDLASSLTPSGDLTSVGGRMDTSEETQNPLGDANVPSTQPTDRKGGSEEIQTSIIEGASRGKKRTRKTSTKGTIAMDVDGGDNVALDTPDMSSSQAPLLTAQKKQKTSQATDERPGGQFQPELPLPASPSTVRTPACRSAQSLTPAPFHSPPASGVVAAPTGSVGSSGVPPAAPSGADVPSLGDPASSLTPSGDLTSTSGEMDTSEETQNPLGDAYPSSTQATDRTGVSEEVQTTISECAPRGKKRTRKSSTKGTVRPPDAPAIDCPQLEPPAKRWRQIRSASASATDIPAPSQPPAKRARTSRNAVSSNGASTSFELDVIPSTSTAVATSPIESASDAPDWFKNILGMMQRGKLGREERWKELVRAWMAFEAKQKYTDTFKLKSTFRPAIIGAWISRARSTTWKPPITDIAQYEIDFMKWWTSLQPDWRISTESDIYRTRKIVFAKVDGDWEVLRRAGLNGLVSVMAGLYYWGSALTGDDQSRDGWLVAVADCLVAFNHLLCDS